MITILSKTATSRLMKKILSESYPGIRCTLRACRGGICVDSVNGPSSQELHEIFPCFCVGICSFNGQNCQHSALYSMFDGSIVKRVRRLFANRRLSKEVEEIAFPILPDGLLERMGPNGDDGWLNQVDRRTFDSVADSVLAKWRPRQYSPTLALVDVVPSFDCHEEVAAKQAARMKAAQEQAEFARLLRSPRRRQKSTPRL